VCWPGRAETDTGLIFNGARTWRLLFAQVRVNLVNKFSTLLPTQTFVGYALSVFQRTGRIALPACNQVAFYHQQNCGVILLQYVHGDFDLFVALLPLLA